MASELKKSSRGYSLIELMISLTIGLVIIGAAVNLFSKSINATWIVSQRAEMQQDARAASNLLTKDISLAGAGMPSGGVALVSGGGILAPRYGCDYTGACHLGSTNIGSITFPTQTVSGNTINYLYGVVPGWKRGVTINGTAGATDVITVVYADTAFLLFDYHVKANDINGNSVTFTLPNPAPNPLDQAVNNPGVGLQQGDLVLFTTTTGGVALAEVTAPVPAGGGPSYTVSFATGSSLLINQNAGTSGNIRNAILANSAGNVGVDLTTKMGAIATRVWLITYYLDNSTGTPTLMRQVNARQPVPVAENVADLRFTYDTYDDNGNLLNATGDGGMGLVPPISPSQIRRINLAHLTFRSQLSGGKSGYQSMDMQTSISARNMSFIDRYK
ncbi:MAG TPA: prepilin-type N-terminal cleavage/methylation domain-containing protein [Terriglobales bacterium]|nr:prepilin-type N-terminal cleavage/methylation domain-containing protein [Terriglobales bacterium]